VDRACPREKKAKANVSGSCPQTQFHGKNNRVESQPGLGFTPPAGALV
jgi:hypothetical protein